MSRSPYRTRRDIINLKPEKESVTWNVIFVTWKALANCVHLRRGSHMSKRERGRPCASRFLQIQRDRWVSTQRDWGSSKTTRDSRARGDHKIPGFAEGSRRGGYWTSAEEQRLQLMRFSVRLCSFIPKSWKASMKQQSNEQRIVLKKGSALQHYRCTWKYGEQREEWESLFCRSHAHSFLRSTSFLDTSISTDYTMRYLSRKLSLNLLLAAYRFLS